MPKLIKIKSTDRNNNVKIFESIAQAASYHKCNESSIRRVLDKPHRYSCARSWSTYSEDVDNKANIFVLDIETTPLRSFTWGLWQQNIYIDQIISNWFMLSWAGKWLGDNTMYSNVLTPEEVINEDDNRIVMDLWHFLDRADIVIAHYGDAFDLPKIRSRFLINGINPPSSYKQIDTKKIASKEFGFSSNKLEALARLFGFKGKDKTDFDLWAECIKGNEDALDQMRSYNEQDIYVLEDVYLKLRPYIKGHPNLDLYIDSEEPVCPACGKHTLEAIPNKFFYTQAVKYQLYRCTSCGAISRAKKGTPYVHKKQISSIPR